MISYQPFFDTLYQKGISEYALIFKYGVPAATLHRIKHNGNITLKTLDVLCDILECDISDIIKHVSDDSEEMK